MQKRSCGCARRERQRAKERLHWQVNALRFGLRGLQKHAGQDIVLRRHLSLRYPSCLLQSSPVPFDCHLKVKFRLLAFLSPTKLIRVQNSACAILTRSPLPPALHETRLIFWHILPNNSSNTSCWQPRNLNSRHLSTVSLKMLLVPGL